MVKAAELFIRFFALGLVSFGGPMAHIGYFRTTFVEKLKWLDDAAYAKLIALSQFLPGPGSSQVGFAIGLRYGGLLGGAAAFLGFTLPSFILLYLLAVWGADAAGGLFGGIVHGLKLLAVVVVADAVIGMYKNFCKEKSSIAIALLAAAVLLVQPGLWVQMGVLAAAALAGIFRAPALPYGSAAGGKFRPLPLMLFAALFILFPFLAPRFDWAALFNAFYQAGSLVFGGGHVVLPLLQESIGGAMTADSFLLGYAAAQAVPGPMFTLASYLGASLWHDAPLTGALIATAAIFLPGFLLVLGLQGGWESLAARPKIAGAAWGINAAVVGLLIHALYHPVFTGAVTGPFEMAAVLLGLGVLRLFKPPILLLVAAFALGGFLLA